MKSRAILWGVVDWVFLLCMLTVNYLSNALPLGGRTTGEISEGFHALFVPAGYAFSIWGLIYLALIGFAIYQALPAQRENPHLRRIGYLFALSCVANVVWLFLWHYEVFSLTIVAMLALLALLIALYLRLGIGRTRVSTAEMWLVHVPFSIYLGWVTVATIANATSLLYYLNWSGWGLSPEAWAVIMLVVGAAVASAVSLTRGDVAYMLVIMWAFAGIAVKHAATPVVASAAWAMTAVVAVMLVVGALLSRRRRAVTA